METTRHTPGPWEVHGDTTSQLFYVHGSNAVCDIRRGSGQYGDGRFHRTPAEDEANARLIAAAPKLAEALKSCERVFAAWVKDANPDGDLLPEESADLDAANIMLETVRTALRDAGIEP